MLVLEENFKSKYEQLLIISFKFLGYFCPEGTASIPSVNNPSGTPSVQNICPTGHYCPPGTQTRDENPCDPGTYNPNSGRQDSGACQACPSGRYCEAGWY